MAVPGDCGARNRNKRDSGDLMLTASDQCFIKSLYVRVHVSRWSERSPSPVSNFSRAYLPSLTYLFRGNSQNLDPFSPCLRFLRHLFYTKTFLWEFHVLGFWTLLTYPKNTWIHCECLASGLSGLLQICQRLPHAVESAHRSSSPI